MLKARLNKNDDGGYLPNWSASPDQKLYVLVPIPALVSRHDVVECPFAGHNARYRRCIHRSACELVAGPVISQRLILSSSLIRRTRRRKRTSADQLPEKSPSGTGPAARFPDETSGELHIAEVQSAGPSSSFATPPPRHGSRVSWEAFCCNIAWVVNGTRLKRDLATLRQAFSHPRSADTKLGA